MSLFLQTAPTVPSLDLDDVKVHLRVDDTSSDELILDLMGAAEEYVKNFTGRALTTETWDWKLDHFPCSGEALYLPKPPVTSVTSITYVDANGDTQTWSSSEYGTDLPTGPQAQRARIYPAYGYSWPGARWIPNAVTVRFVCGYGSGEAVPSSIKAAEKLLIGHWYENREAVNVSIGANVQNVPMAVDALLWPFKVF